MNRIRRNVTDPVFPEKRPPRLSKIINVPSNNEDLQIRYKQTAWRFVCDEMRNVKQRETVGVILVNTRHAGSFKVAETCIAAFTSATDFYEEMDNHSQQTAHLAETLITHWDPTDVSNYGDIIELQRAWMVPAFSNSGRLERSIKSLLQQLFDRRSLLILQSFPLEYENVVTDDNSEFHERRRLAMMRHYRRILGVQPLPEECGYNGWMFAIPSRLKDIVPEPSAQEVDNQ